MEGRCQPSSEPSTTPPQPSTIPVTEPGGLFSHSARDSPEVRWALGRGTPVVGLSCPAESWGGVPPIPAPACFTQSISQDSEIGSADVGNVTQGRGGGGAKGKEYEVAWENQGPAPGDVPSVCTSPANAGAVVDKCRGALEAESPAAGFAVGALGMLPVAFSRLWGRQWCWMGPCLECAGTGGVGCRSWDVGQASALGQCCSRRPNTPQKW